MRWASDGTSALLLLSLACVRPLAGQAISTAAVQGTVAGQDSTPIRNAVVEVRNTATGQFWRIETSGSGRYYIGTVAVGGPYEVVVRAIGFVPAAKTGIMLTVAQRYIADFFLEPAVVTLREVVVQATANPQANHGRTGPAQLISDSAIRQLPSYSREVVELTVMSPQVNVSPFGEIGVGGQNPRYTTYLVDGGQNTDLYYGGFVGRFGLPRSISPNAVAQLQVLAAPADVRNGDFAGGAINIVTRSGTNEWHGSAFGFYQSDALIGADASGAPQPGKELLSQYGFTLSGPIVRDRLQFFLNADLQHHVSPDVGPYITDTAGGADLKQIGIRYASVARFDSILTHTYNLEAGGLGWRGSTQPAADLFVKLSAQVGSNHQLELSDHYARIHQVDGAEQNKECPDNTSCYSLGSTASQHYVTENALQLTSRGLLGRQWSNELMLGYLWSEYDDPSTDRAHIVVWADNGVIVADPWNAGGHHGVLNTSTVELTDNVTVDLGVHVLTIGTHDELLQFQDNDFFLPGPYWEFENLDSLAAGRPDDYERRLPGPLAPSGPYVNLRADQLGLYAQDQWAPSREVMITYGVRVDVPYLPDVGALNSVLRDSLGLETGQFPSGHPLWSPRLGVNYDIGGRGMTFLRGSAGLFSGQPPYRWIANGYRESGQEQLRLACKGAAAPHFKPFDPPGSCATGPETIPQITVFDRGLRYPQNWKFSLGLDQRLPWGLVATVDLLYTYWVNQFYFSDANLSPPVGAEAGEGGRLLYGTIDSNSGSSTPSRVNSAFGAVVRVSDRSGDRAFLASMQLQRQFGSGFGLSASYTYAHEEDAMSLTRFNSGTNLAQTPLVGSQADRGLSTSFFNVPHRVALTASIGLPLRTRLSLTYAGSSQTPYTYVVNGDANADGLNDLGAAISLVGQDIVYVPRNVMPGGDIDLWMVDTTTGLKVPASASEYAKLDEYIKSERCLDRQRGQIMARNSCQNPWYGELDAQFAANIPTNRGQSFQLTLDVQDLPALFGAPLLFNPSAKKIRTYGGADAVLPLLHLIGYDPVKQRGQYLLDLPGQQQAYFDLTRWAMQLGVRYSF